MGSHIVAHRTPLQTELLMELECLRLEMEGEMRSPEFPAEFRELAETWEAASAPAQAVA